MTPSSETPPAVTDYAGDRSKPAEPNSKDHPMPQDQPIETLVSEMKAAAELAVHGDPTDVEPWVCIGCGAESPRKIKPCNCLSGLVMIKNDLRRHAEWRVEAGPHVPVHVPAANVLTLLASHTAQAEEIKALRESADEHALFDAEAEQAFKDLDHQVSTLSTKLVEREQEVEQLRLAICGGEDAPGYAMSLPLQRILEVAEENQQSWLDETEMRMEAEAKLVESEAREGAYRWLAENQNCELSFDYGDADDDGKGWCVHRVNGGRNDREWTLIGTGATPEAALLAAKAAS